MHRRDLKITAYCLSKQDQSCCNCINCRIDWIVTQRLNATTCISQAALNSICMTLYQTAPDTTSTYTAHLSHYNTSDNEFSTVMLWLEWWSEINWLK